MMNLSFHSLHYQDVPAFVFSILWQHFVKNLQVKSFNLIKLLANKISLVLISRTSNCKSGSVCCDNTKVAPKTRPPTRRPPPTTTYAPPPPTSPPDPREECPGSCIVGLLSFTCFRNAEMTDLFKCKKSGTQCCAPKTKIQEHMDRLHRQNYTYQYNPNVGPINPNYPPPSQYYNTNNYPPQQPQHYPPPHVYEPTISPNLQQQPSSISYEIVQPTSQKPLPVYSKYVCGVKGTSRVARSFLNSSKIAISRNKRSDDFERELANVYKTKTTERLVLGSNPVPIPIVYTDNHTNDFDIVPNYGVHNNSYVSHRRARVVGGEDAENGEWCWQVALINSLNQYLCGGALIGKYVKY